MKQEEYEAFIENMKRFLLPIVDSLHLDINPYYIYFKQGDEVHEEAAYTLNIMTYETLWERPGREVTVIFEDKQHWVEFDGWLGKMTVDGLGLRDYQIYSTKEGKHFDKEYLSYVWKEMQNRGAVMNEFDSFVEERRNSFELRMNENGK